MRPNKVETVAVRRLNVYIILCMFLWLLNVGNSSVAKSEVSAILNFCLI